MDRPDGGSIFSFISASCARIVMFENEQQEVMKMISVKHLTKYYGDVCAVNDLSFEIEEGHVYGFLGANGAGKSTTMNIMTGCLSATSGEVKIDGHDIFEDAAQAKRLIGYLPEHPPLYMTVTPEEYLQFVGEAKGLRGEELKNQINEVITQTGIEHVRSRRIAALSKGYKQRVGIAQALLGNPKVIILDEPTVGLDPIQIVEIRMLIRDLSKIQTGKGTVRVMKQMIQFVTGRDAVIMEYFKWHDWMRRGASQLERYEKLFGKNEDQFCVILDLTREGQPVVPEELQKLLQEYTPLGMNSNLIFLDWSSQMDTHCYLDKNSRLAIPERADTSGFSLDGNYVLG